LDPLAVTWSATNEAAPLGREKMRANVLTRITSRSEVHQLAFRNGRMYQRSEPLAGSSGKTKTVEIAFDRSVLYFGEPAKDREDPKDRSTLIKWMPAKDQPEAGYFSCGYFTAAGVRLPTRVQGLVEAWRPQSELLALLAEGGQVEATGPIELDGRSLVRVQVTAQDRTKIGPPIDLDSMEQQLRTSKLLSNEEIQRRLTAAQEAETAQPPVRRYDFYFDPKRGYAVHRLDTQDEAGRLLMRSECTEHEQLPGRDVWMPRRCRVEKYTFVGLPDQYFGSPLYVNQFRVSAFDLQPWPDERFELKYTTPGTSISDGTFPEVEGKEGVSYEVPATPEQLDQVIKFARRRYQAQTNAEKRAGPTREMFLVINGVLVVAMAVYYVLRWRKARSA
jgi:hypothetical protein